MKAREVVGRTIVGVIQERVGPDTSGHPAAVHLHAILLDDGSRISFTAGERDNDYIIRATVYRRTEVKP